jgi:ribosome-associated heat shock protein Hsp15
MSPSTQNLVKNATNLNYLDKKWYANHCVPYFRNRITIMIKVRVDKWLWSIRIFKSRTMATDSCKSGKVKVGGESVKPSHLITVNEVVSVKKDGFNFQYKVLGLLEKRVGAPIAITCYADITPEEEKLKYTAWFANATGKAEIRERGTGRPTKRDRRDLEGFKDGDDEDDDASE